MKDIGSLSHTKWDCKYHVVFIPKYRRQALYQELRQYLGKIFHDLARQKECRIEEGHLCAAMCICSSRFRRNIQSHR
jgi:putative transposase